MMNCSVAPAVLDCIAVDMVYRSDNECVEPALRLIAGQLDFYAAR